MPEEHPQLVLTFRPNVELVSVVRRFTSNFYEKILGDPDATSRVALATHELLENAVKYSADGCTSIRIGIEPADPAAEPAAEPAGDRRIRVSTTNVTDPTHLATAMEIIDGIRSAESPFAYLQQSMRATAKRAEGSGLGLARICAEGEMTMRYVVEGRTLSIFAEMRI